MFEIFFFDVLLPLFLLTLDNIHPSLEGTQCHASDHLIRRGAHKDTAHMGNSCVTCFRKKKEPRRRRSRSTSSETASESGESTEDHSGKEDDPLHDDDHHDEYSEGGHRIAKSSPFADAALANRAKRRERLEKRMAKYQELQYEVSMKFNQSTHVLFVVETAKGTDPLEDELDNGRHSPGPAQEDESKFNVSGCNQNADGSQPEEDSGPDEGGNCDNGANEADDTKHLFRVPTLLGSGDDLPHSVREDSGSTEGPPLHSGASTPTSRGSRLVYLPLGVSDGTIQDNKARRLKKKEVLMD